MESKSIRNNIFNLKKDITNICIGCKRNPKDIRIVAASKTKSIKEISLAYKSGISNFGENYLQEAIPKIEGLEKKDINWHFIGSIQKKKCKKIALLFDWVHTIDRVEIAEKLNEYRKILPNKLNILIQININEEKSKAGINISDLKNFSDKLLPFNNLEVKGLMALPKQTNDAILQTNNFSNLYKALDQLKLTFPEACELSMGMSNDYPAAITQSSTIVRIGTTIFGKRV